MICHAWPMKRTVGALMKIQSIAAMIVVVSLMSPVKSFGSSGTEGASFLDIPVGAGPAALGSAYTALAKNAYAPVWNPAGLSFVDAPQLAGQHLAYLESIHHEYLGIAYPLTSSNAVGFAAQYLGTGISLVNFFCDC